MRKFWVLGGILLLSSCAFLFLTFSFNTNEREKYETFLHQEYSNIPTLSETQLDDIPKPTHPDLAAIQNYFMTIDPKEQRVPVERLKTAYKTTKSIQASSNLKSSNISWEEIPSSMAGRTRTVMYDPNDVSNKKVWAGTATGGLWVNNDITDENSSWESVEDFWASLAISTIVYDPNNTNTFYVGTGEAQTALTIYRESSGVGAGIFKTTDGGNSWSLLESTKDFKYITDIVIKDEDGQSVLYAGVVSGVYKGASHQSTPSDGLYRSSNGGSTWEQVLPKIPGSNEPYAPSDIEISANGRIFVGTMRNLEDKGGASILYSDEGSSGSWTTAVDYQSKIQNDPSENIPGRVIIASAPSDPNRVYALIGAGYIHSGDGLKRSIGKYILKSTKAGEIWSELDVPTTNSSYWATIAWHALAISVHPEDGDMVYIGGLNCFKTDNGGTTWYRISDWSGNTFQFVHADIHRFVFNPNNFNQLLVCTDGGVFYTSSPTTTAPIFNERNKDLNCLQFYACDIGPGNGNVSYLGGLQDNGSILFKGNRIGRFSSVSAGDGAYCFFDKTDGSHFITSVYHNYYIFHNGETSIRNTTHYNTGTFISPADFDSYQNILYANATTFKLQLLNQLVRYKGVPDNVTSGYINITTDVNVPFSHIKVSPHQSSSTTLFAGTQSGRLFKVTNADGTPSTEEVGGSNFPVGNISCVAIGGSEDSLMVTYSNYGLSSIWQSYDGGNTWEDKEGNLPDMPVRWAIYHPNNAKKAYLATELGVWFSDELDQSDPEWIPVNEGLANVRIDMLKLREEDNTILAATHGRGFAISNTNPVSIPEDINNQENGISIYPNPSNGILKLNISVDKMVDVDIKVFDQIGKLCFTKSLDQLFGNTTNTLNLEHLAKGNYIVLITMDKKTLKEKIILQ